MPLSTPGCKRDPKADHWSVFFMGARCGRLEHMHEPEMPETLPALSRSANRRQRSSNADEGADQKGFGGKAGAKGSRRKSGKKRSPALSKADWGPLGKHPDLDAIVARQRLHLPLSGRLTEPQVTRAWKEAAAEHPPDRGGLHDTMQLVKGARDLLLGRGL